MYVFFVLSGFLITELLVEERLRRGTISLRNFFIRRSLRLLPALTLFLLIWLAAVAVFGQRPWMTTVPGGGSGAGVQFGTALEGVAAAFTYLTNWATIAHGFSGYVPLGHIWSLSVEEQIYALWAPLLALLLVHLRSQLIGVVALGLCVLSTVEVALAWPHETNRVFMGTDTRAGAFLLGAAIAMYWQQHGFATIGRLVRVCIISLSCLGLILCATPLAHPKTGFSFVLCWSAATVLSGILVLAAVESRPQRDAQSRIGRCLTYLGRRSYALYLWHYVWLTWLRDLGLIGVVLAMLCTLCSAELSWQLVERRALHLKHRLCPARSPEPEVSGQSTAVVVAG